MVLKQNLLGSQKERVNQIRHYSSDSVSMRRERATQNRVIRLFHEQLGYDYLGNLIALYNNHCRDAHLPEPTFLQEDVFKTILWRKTTPQVTPEVTPEVAPEKTRVNVDVQALEYRLMLVISGEMSRQTLMNALGLSDAKNFRDNYLEPAIQHGWMEMTNPKSKGSNQSYRLTRKGKIFQTKLKKLSL